MSALAPNKITVRTYQVGFGDCFLLTFHYPPSGKRSRDRHVLIDFGSTRRKRGTPGDQMLRIAKDIREVCQGKLDAVVATHRHQDHISGFSTNKKGDAPGDIIASLNPSVVIQPWTEHPRARTDATAPPRRPSDRRAFVAFLDAMQRFAAGVLVRLGSIGTPDDKRRDTMRCVVCTGAAALTISVPEVWRDSGHAESPEVGRLRHAPSHVAGDQSGRDNRSVRGLLRIPALSKRGDALVGFRARVGAGTGRRPSAAAYAGFLKQEQLAVRSGPAAQSTVDGSEQCGDVVSAVYIECACAGRLSVQNDDGRDAYERTIRVVYAASGRAATSAGTRPVMRDVVLRDLIEEPHTEP